MVVRRNFEVRGADGRKFAIVTACDNAGPLLVSVEDQFVEVSEVIFAASYGNVDVLKFRFFQLHFHVFGNNVWNGQSVAPI